MGWLFTRANPLNFVTKPASFIGLARTSIALVEEEEGGAESITTYMDQHSESDEAEDG